MGGAGPIATYPRPSRTAWMLMVILGLALLTRLRGLGFGLPALYDPDEPLFVLLALRLLRDGTLNPGWFGHPGTTVIYALALIDVGVFAWGRFVSGAIPGTAAFGRAIYTDPSIVVLPGRAFILCCGLATILLTFLLARRLFDARAGLVAAALLAIDPIHIRYSQIIRTDMLESVFTLLVVFAAIAIARCGRSRDYRLAGVALGFGIATKWPAATAAIGVLGAAALRWRDTPGERGRVRAGLAWFVAATVAALFVASPFLFLDTATVLANLGAEKQPHHLGATGGGVLFNMAWYLGGPLRLALSATGLLLTALGLWLAARRSREFAAVVGTTVAAFLVSISAQTLIWERWVVPLLPLLSIALAVGMLALVRRARALAGRPGSMIAAGLAGVAVAVPLALVADAQAAERRDDTRRRATDWARRHVMPGSSVATEYLAFDVLSQPWRFLYPAGDRGCVDVRANLSGKIRYSTIGRWRGQRSVVDLGSVAPDLLDTCRADWVITVNWDRYRDEAAFYPAELANYRRLTRGGRVAATFRPIAGRIGGPVVRVIHLPPA